MPDMSEALGGGDVSWKGELASVSETVDSPGSPRLALEKTGWLDQFASSLEVLIHGPVAPKAFLGDPYFRDCWIDQRFPKMAFAAAVSLQVLLVLFPPPVWNVRSPSLAAPAPAMELTWYGPVKDFPAIMPAVKTPKPRPTAKRATNHEADTFHPRLTILSEPLHPTHPRQTLIQPAAPKEPPKILPDAPQYRAAAGLPARKAEVASHREAAGCHAS